MAKEQKATAPAPGASTSDPHPVYPTHYGVKIHTLRPEGTCRATASVDINGCFAVRGVKVMESSNGLFVAMPSYKAGNGEYKNICFPCTKEARTEFDHAVLTAYQQALTQSMKQSQQSPPDPTAQQAQKMGM